MKDEAKAKTRQALIHPSSLLLHHFFNAATAAA